MVRRLAQVVIMPADRQHVALVYPLSTDKQWTLMQFHKAVSDPSYGRYNGLSAYPSAEESLAEAARRALRVAGIQEATLTLRGVVHWSRFDPHDWPLVGHFFLASPAEDAVLIQEDSHFRRQWMDVESLLSGQVPCWPGDAHIFPLLFDENPRPFHGLMVYDQGIPKSWRFERT